LEEHRYPLLDEKVWHTVLKNGLHIYVDQKPGYNKQFAFFATNYGGMNMRFRVGNEPWNVTPAGVAHFLEHKMFDTQDGNALQILAANGVDPNAFTSSDMTGYYFEGSEHFEENLRTLLSFVSVPWFTDESVSKEQGIIAQEIRMGEDDPGSEIFYSMLSGLYKNNPIRVKVAGTVESISKITAETLYECHRAFYAPGNMVLCVAGNVDPKEVERIASEVLPETSSPEVETDFGDAEENRAVRAFEEKVMAVSAPLFQIGFKGVPADGGQRLRQQLVGTLAADAFFGPSSPLYSKLYDEGIINNSFGGGYEDGPQCAYLEVSGESKEPEQIRKLLLDEAARIAKEGIDSDLWERQKKAAYGISVRQLNSLENICIETAQAHFLGEDFLRFPELYRSIQKEDAERMIAEWCTFERSTLAVIRPKEELR